MKLLNNTSIKVTLMSIAILCSTHTNAREFKDLKGRKINATVLDVTDGKAKLKLNKNGRIYTVPFTQLSKSDVEFLKNWKKQHGDKKKPKKKTTPNKTPISTKKLISMPATHLMKAYGLEENYDDKWPTLVKGDNSPEIKTVLEDDNKHQYIYHSPNYEFVCDVKLSKSVVKKFAVLFETTRNYCRELPLSLMKAHLPGEVYRNKIVLFEKRSTYIKNGGPASSAGVYYPHINTVFVPLTSLGVKKRGSSYTYDYKGENSTLSHELTHQLTNFECFFPGADGWFSEGLAEYVAMTPYRGGKFSVNNSITGIKKGVTEYGRKGNGGRALGKKINAPALKSFMLQPYSSFIKNGNLNYGLAALITYYYIHLDGNKDRANLNAFLKALNKGIQGEEALKVLLNGRSWDEMEAQISKAWSKKGIKITFN